VPIPQRRIDDRIRELCAQLKTASADDLQSILKQLLTLVHQKSDRLRRRGARLLLSGEHLEGERRKPFQLAAKTKSNGPEKPIMPDAAA